MADPIGEAHGTKAVVRQNNVGMGVAIGSLLMFLLVAIGAFWAINGDVITGPAPAMAAEANPAAKPTEEPGQIGNGADNAIEKPR